ncbi:MAG: leucine-rich repeat domain-containing protein [Treponemataceae bacterium]|nr:leucine-rich repeat domain-containing protein [Treponemataceae bacterium]
MNKKWVAVVAALAVTAAAFAAKEKFPAYLKVRGTTVKGYTGDVPADLIIPDGVKEIDDEAFRDCTSLVSVSIPGSVKEIGDEAFRGCTSLKTVTIADGVKEINDGAFLDCTSLTNVTIGDGVKEIIGSHWKQFGWDNGVFHGCTSLTTVTIPSSVTAIGDIAFEGCPRLREIQFKGTIAQWRAIQGSDRLKVMSIQCSDGYLGVKEVPAYLKFKRVREWGNAAEIYVTGYTDTVPANLVIPDGVTKIDSSAFSRCTSLVSVTIPDGVTAIDPGAFSGCTSLVSVTIPGSVTYIGGEVFGGCTSIEEIQFNGTRAQWQAIQNSYGVKISLIRCTDTTIGIEAVPDYFKMDGTKVTGYTGTLPANLVIPDGVTEIERGVLSGCFDIESVTIPGSVLADAQRSAMSDGSYEMVRIKFNSDKFTGMFSDCTYLERVTILDGAVRIPLYMFFNCTSLKSITIPDSMTTIAQGAFYNCASLKSIAIPPSVTAIGNIAFSDCASLTAVEIPAGVTEISYGVFGGCTSLASVTIPDGVTAIGERAFQDCASLKSVTIPRGVTQIGEQAFRGCKTLRSVTIPRGMKAISTGMFYECTSLTSVSIPRSVTQIGDGAFLKCSPNLKIQYDGTKAQWNAISGDKPEATVQCSDGVL